MLRKKKFQESLLDKTDKQLENIERMVYLHFRLSVVFFLQKFRLLHGTALTVQIILTI